MPSRNRDRRYQINLPLLKEIRLVLLAYTKGVSKTRMSEAILIEAVSGGDNWRGAIRDLQQEAAIRQITIAELIQEILAADGFDQAIDVNSVDWSVLTSGGDPDLGGDGDPD